MSIYRGHTSNEVYLASLLYSAIEDVDERSIKKLLEEKHANPNLVLPKKHIAAFHLIIGHEVENFAITVTKLFLQNGGNPNVKSDDGLTPVHIAAAWGRYEILHLLLLCGGDPEQCDINNKTPMHYAVEENHAECFDILRWFAVDRYKILNNEEKDNHFDLILDKIVVNNGSTVGEYEVINEYKTDSISEKNLQQLAELPKSDSNEFVMNWFKNQPKTNTIPLKLLSGNTTEISDYSAESSMNESDDEKLIEKKLVFRKIYRKKAKKSSRKLDRTESTFRSGRRYSAESGIEPFTNSISISNSIDMSQKLPETSSDYVTCSPSSSPPVLEKNIFEITEDLSVNNDDIKSLQSVVTKSEGIGSEVSIISVSEIYKYVDKDEGIVLFEKRLLKTPVSDYNGSIKSYKSSLPETIDYVDYDSDVLRKELTVYGYNPGPITVTTKRVYLKKLIQLKKNPITTDGAKLEEKRVYSNELEKTLKNPEWLKNITPYKALEESIFRQFNTPDQTRPWRGGLNKTSFTYLLLDPRITNNLPHRAENMKLKDIWETFLSAIFYVGKGKRSRPYAHLYEAIAQYKKDDCANTNKKLARIKEIWNENCGVVCLHLFQNTIPAEAYTREAAIISALDLKNLCNIKLGDFYGTTAMWSKKERSMLGVYLLYKAMMIFLNEGERQLYPSDID